MILATCTVTAVNLMKWTILLICSFPPRRPDDFVNLFVFVFVPAPLQLGEGPPRAPAAREAVPGTISGGRCPPEPPRFFVGVEF